MCTPNSEIYHSDDEFQGDGITNRTISSTKTLKYAPSCHANLHIIDVHVQYDHSKGKMLILPNNINVLVQIKGVQTSWRNYTKSDITFKTC